MLCCAGCQTSRFKIGLHVLLFTILVDFFVAVVVLFSFWIRSRKAPFMFDTDDAACAMYRETTTVGTQVFNMFSYSQRNWKVHLSSKNKTQNKTTTWKTEPEPQEHQVTSTSKPRVHTDTVIQNTCSRDYLQHEVTEAGVFKINKHCFSSLIQL